MQEEQLKILKMVEEGLISADEAQELMTAMKPEALEEVEPQIVQQTTTAALLTDGLMDPADFERFRSFWTIPFAISLSVLVVTTILFLVLILNGGWLTVGGLLCMAPLVSLSLIGTLLSVWSRYARWIHLRVQEKGGRRIAISVPAPLRMVHWGIGFAAGRTSAETREQLLAAQELLQEMDSDTQPLIVDVNDEDGDHVQIFIG